MKIKTIFSLLSIISMVSIAFTHSDVKASASASASASAKAGTGCHTYTHTHTHKSKSKHSSSSSDSSSSSSAHSKHASRGGGVGKSCNQDKDCKKWLACDTNKHECVDPCSPNICRYQRKYIHFKFQIMENIFGNCFKLAYLNSCENCVQFKTKISISIWIWFIFICCSLQC